VDWPSKVRSHHPFRPPHLLPFAPCCSPLFPSIAFTRSLSTLLRLSSPGSTSGDIDFTCTSSRLSLSVVNPSRTAFGVVHFYQNFFAHYDVQQDKNGRAFKFAVTGKVIFLFFSFLSSSISSATVDEIHL
jgi:hypothetical protein